MSEPESEYDDAFDDDDHPVLSPPLLMRSFLTIASSSVACLLIYAILGMALAALFFPVVRDAMFGDQARAGADISIPVTMLIPWVVLHGICSVGIGWFTAKAAPFAPEKHGLILAIFLFIGWAQKVFAGDPSKLQLNVAFTIIVPLAIAYGAKLYCNGQPDLESTDSSSNTEATEEVT